MTRWTIIHAYTGEVVAHTEGDTERDALAAYSIDQGFADPRTPEAIENYGDDWFYTLPDGTVGMVITNYEVHAVAEPQPQPSERKP